MNRDQLFLDLDFQELEGISIKEDLSKKVRIPENKFPPKFFFKSKDFLAGGYFVSYYPKTTINEAVSFAKKEDWKSLAELNADFIILLIDFRHKKIQVLTDQSGKFPCYYHFSSNRIFLSTSFNWVMKKINSPSLNIEAALEFVYRENFIAPKTFIEEINSVPPATLLEVKDGKISLHPQLNPDEFLNEEFENFDSLQSFSNKFLEVLNDSLKDRLSACEKFGFGADLSSGFDSSLINFLLKKNSGKRFISYCEIAKNGVSDTDPDIVSAFARKHNLNVKFVSYDDFSPFSTKEDFEFIEKGPSAIQKSQLDYYLKLVSKDGNLLHFTGEGGDEAYWSNDEFLSMCLLFPKQMTYFNYISLRKYGIDKVLTSKGISFLLDKNRIRLKELTPIFVSHSVFNLFSISFDLHWENKVWPITPFADTRVIQTARGIPSKGVDRSVLKQEIWKLRRDIFVEGNFRQKGGTEEHYRRFLSEKADFVISLLEKSQLGAKGWLNSQQIIKDILDKKYDLYYEGDVIAYLTNLLEIEYFIQINNVRVL